MRDSPAKQLIAAASWLRDEVDRLSFSAPVTHVYNPLRYAWDTHQNYLSRVSDQGARTIFLGMNPGPWGMAQTGVPFGEVDAVRDWLGVQGVIERPPQEHPKRPIQGFQCERHEVSGQRLWGLLAERFGTPDRFFRSHFVLNYCPLVFMEASGRNRTPDKLPAAERRPLDDLCDRHLVRALEIMKPQFVVAVGAYAETCLRRALPATQGDAQLSRILHPSPASPAANRDWAGTVTDQLISAGVWES